MRLHKLEKAALPTEERPRNHFGTLYFREGTTANEVCVEINKRHGAKESGIWLLQIQSRDPRPSESNNNDGLLREGEYETVKDSKHKIADGKKYVALHYTGMDIFLVT